MMKKTLLPTTALAVLTLVLPLSAVVLAQRERPARNEKNPSGSIKPERPNSTAAVKTPTPDDFADTPSALPPGRQQSASALGPARENISDIKSGFNRDKEQIKPMNFEGYLITYFASKNPKVNALPDISFPSLLEEVAGRQNQERSTPSALRAVLRAKGLSNADANAVVNSAKDQAVTYKVKK